VGKIEYIIKFRAQAPQLNGYVTGRKWCEMGVSLEDAVEWAKQGFLPSEAAVYVAAGTSPADAALHEARDARRHTRRQTAIWYRAEDPPSTHGQARQEGDSV